FHPNLAAGRFCLEHRGAGASDAQVLRWEATTMINLDLTGKRAVLTGASLGIGAATVRALADQGARVWFCARGADNVAALAGYRPPSGEGSVSGASADMADR